MKPIISQNLLNVLKNKIIPINRFVKYSILPKPNGYFFVGLCLDILVPIIQIISVAKSQNVWRPSAKSDDNPRINPPAIFAIEIIKLFIIL